MISAKSNAEGFLSSSTGKKIPAGIHSKCRVTDINLGENFIDFIYGDSQGRVHNKRVWFPDPSKITPKEGESMAEAIHRDAEERAAHITLHLKHMSVDDEWMAIAAPTFRDYAVLSKRYLDKCKDTALVNIKLLLDKDLEWSEFPRFPNYLERFIEGEEPTLRFSEWELKNRMKPHQSTDDISVPGESGTNDTFRVKYY